MKELWVSLDRYGVMRPTRNVPKGKIANPNNNNNNDKDKDKDNDNDNDNKNESSIAPNPEDVEDHPNWKTKELWLHWDLNPCKC